MTLKQKSIDLKYISQNQFIQMVVTKYCEKLQSTDRYRIFLYIFNKNKLFDEDARTEYNQKLYNFLYVCV